MGVRNLDKIFRPGRIALIGARDAPGHLEQDVLRNLIGGGYRGVVYPVSPACEAIRGIPAHPDLASLPHRPDLAVVCSPAEAVPAVVQECGENGVPGVLILSAGFRETGAAGRRLERRIARIARRFEDMRIVGPSSLGIISPRQGLNASSAVAMPQPGRLAFVSQSRALSNAVLDWAADKGIGFSCFVSTGSMLDVGFGDIIDYLSTDPETRAIILYLQSVEHSRRFMSAARAFARTRPIVAYKAGRFSETAEAAASHTGAMVAEDAVYEAALQRAGVVRVMELDDIFDVAELLASQRLPRGARLAIVGNAGGPAVVAADALLARGGELARLAEATEKRLEKELTPVRSHANPVDLLDDAPPERFGAASRILLEDPSVDAVLVIFAAHARTDPAETARGVIEAAGASRKPVLAAWMGGESVRVGIQLLSEASIPTHHSPEQAVRAFMHLVSYARNLEALYETPREIPVSFGRDRSQRREKLRPLLREHPERLTEKQAEAFLDAYGIPVCPSEVARSSDHAVKAAEEIGYPVVLKILSPRIVHKVDMGGVALGLEGPGQVREAYEQMIRIAEAQELATELEGVLVQKMVRLESGLEMILGAKKDPTFGAVIMIGMGGVAAGVLRDRALGLPPLNERLVSQMLESLRFWPMLRGYRGRPAVDLDRLIEVVIRFSFLIADHPEIQEFDINPLLVTPDEVVALDAVAILDRQRIRRPGKPYHHLAIRPYPEEHVRQIRLDDGTRVALRPIRAEDEPLWHRLVAGSSPESIRARFRSLFKRASHEMAVQHCVIDYEREIAIVAETDARGERELMGVGQLIADVDHESAEYAVLVPDSWQGQGIGGMLLDYCLELASRWGIERVIAETEPANTRMLASFRSRGFELRADVRPGDDAVLLEKSLARRSQQ